MDIPVECDAMLVRPSIDGMGPALVRNLVRAAEVVEKAHTFANESRSDLFSRLRPSNKPESDGDPLFGEPTIVVFVGNGPYFAEDWSG